MYVKPIVSTKARLVAECKLGISENCQLVKKEEDDEVSVGCPCRVVSTLAASDLSFFFFCVMGVLLTEVVSVKAVGEIFDRFGRILPGRLTRRFKDVSSV